MNFTSTNKKYDYFLRILLLGKDQIGKTLFCKRIELCNDYKSFNKLPKDYLITIGIDFYVTRFKFNNKIFKLQIWDIAGQKRFSTTNKVYYRGANSFFIFYDALDRQSFEEAKNYYKFALKNNDKAIYFLIRSKYDLNSKENKEIVSDEEALKFADKNNLIFAHLSSFEKSFDGINDIFEIMIKEYYLRKTNLK